MRLLVYEQWEGGHYYNYLEHIIPKAASIADRVIVCVTARAYSTNFFQERFQHIARLDNVVFYPELKTENPALPIRDRLKILRSLYSAIKLHSPDYVMIPSADSQHLLHGLLGLLSLEKKPTNIPIEATLHYNYGPGIKRLRDEVKGLIYNLSYRGSTWAYLNFVNAHYFDSVKEKPNVWVNRACLVPDPVPQPSVMTKEEARAMLGIPLCRKYIGFLGFLDRRNNVSQLLQAFIRADLSHDCTLLLAGKAPESLRVLINNHYREWIAMGRIIFIDRFLTDVELLNGYQALDVCCIPRINFPGLSSLALKSVVSRCPLLVHDFGWLGYIVKKFSLGNTCNMANTNDFARAIFKSLEESSDFFLVEAARKLIQFHSVDNFSEHMIYRMVSYFNIPYEDKRLTWEWVNS